MTCGQLPLGGCGNPDLSHDGPCTPYPRPVPHYQLVVQFVAALRHASDLRGSSPHVIDYYDTAANMIEAQAARITELEREVESLNADHSDDGGHRKALAGITVLEQLATDRLLTIEAQAAHILKLEASILDLGGCRHQCACWSELRAEIHYWRTKTKEREARIVELEKERLSDGP